MGLLILQKSVRASRFLPPRDFSKTIKPWFFELFFGALPFCSLKQTWMAHRGHSTLRRRHETHSPAPHCFFCCFWYCSFILYLFIFPYFCERVQHWRLSHWTSSQVRCTGASVDTFRAPCLCSRPVPAPHRRFVLIRSSRRSSEHQRHVLLWPSHESLDEVKNLVKIIKSCFHSFELKLTHHIYIFSIFTYLFSLIELIIFIYLIIIIFTFLSSPN